MPARSVGLVHSRIMALDPFRTRSLEALCCCGALRLDQSGVNNLWIKMERVRDSDCTGALPLRHIPRLPSLTSQSRHLPSLADLSFPRNPPPIPSTRVLVPMCRFSRYEGPRAPPTSAGGQVAGLFGRRGELLRVISRAAGCGARCVLRSATVGVSLAVSRY